MERYVTKGNKKLRFGYTTGSCAAGAAKAGVWMLLGSEDVDIVDLPTPMGWKLRLTVQDVCRNIDEVVCAVQKDSGDDPDVTNGILIYAKVKKSDSGIKISGGQGIGVVTQKGLSNSVGSAAINETPTKMIEEAAKSVAAQFDYNGGFDIEIFAPEGERISKKTFNERLGIKGGISILGTTGIVEPMSEQALIESLKIEMNVLAAKDRDKVLFCPGNYGWTFAKEQLCLDMSRGVKISNYVGEMLDHALGIKFKELLMVAHIGKAVKIAGGIMNTHSKFADCRTEIMAAHALWCGADGDSAREVLNCISTDAMVDVLKNIGMLDCVMDSITRKIEENIQRRLFDEMKAGVVLFSNEHGLLCIGKTAAEMLEGFGIE